MQKRAPTYSVTTVALVLIAVGAFGVRYAARFLPERQPNDLEAEYGEYVRRSMRETVEWHPYGPTAFRQAKERGKIVFLDVGTVMSLSSKRFSEDFATDGEYRMLLHDHFEPIKIDAFEMPWVVDALSLQLAPFFRTERWLAVTADDRGGILSATKLLAQSGDKSLSTWLEELAKLRYANPGEVLRRANASLEERSAKAVGELAHGPCNEDVARAWANIWLEAAQAGVFERNVSLVSTLPVEAFGGLGTESADMALLRVLLELAVSPSYDPIDGGFFIAALDPQWRRPIASKVTGHSLQLAATFAEAGSRFDAPLFKAIALRTVSWASNRRFDQLFDVGLGTDQDAAESSPYYSLSEGDVESLPFWIGPSGFPRIQAVGGFEMNVTSRRTQLILEAADRLQNARRNRPRPRRDRGQYADQNSQAISGLFRIGTALKDDEVIAIANQAYAAAKSTYLQPLGDVLHAPTGRGRLTGYCNSYVWFARAAIDGYLATGNSTFLADAELVMGRTIELFRGESGALMSYLPSLLSQLRFDLEIFQVADTELPSANAVAARNLADLALITKSIRYRTDAESIIKAFSGRFAGAVAPAGMVWAAMCVYRRPANLPARQ